MKDNKVLIVDDEPRNVKLLSAYLKADGFDPIQAYNGEEAIRLAKSENPDVILLDIMMPNMDGFEVTARLKTENNTKLIPIVLVTSLDGANNRTKGLNVGADEFLTKPINRSELIARVRALQRLKKMQEELQNRKQIVSTLSDDDFNNPEHQNTILLIEDDNLLSRQIVTVLSSVEINCSIVHNTASAKEHLKEHYPDLILMDRILPDGDGMDLLAEIKQSDSHRDIPIIIITAITDLELKILGLEKGADDYLIKPIENTELRARVKAGIRRHHAIKNLKRNLEQAQSCTVTDKLTGIRNRYYLDADLNHRIAQVNRSPEKTVSILMIDIDNFKNINDTFGHLIGDKILCLVADQLSFVARAADIVTRYGGEEFCIVLPETNIDEAYAVAERMRENIEQYQFPDINGKKITISAGAAEYSINDKTATTFLTRADDALYRAKSMGRNRVCKSEQATPQA